MSRLNVFAILVILLMFCSVSTFEIKRKSKVSVLNIIDPITFEIDINNNKRIDYGETICIPNLQTFSKDIKTKTDVNISDFDITKLNYLANEFAQNKLKDKKVKIKLTNNENQNCKYADIIINNQSYKKNITDSGLVLNNNTLPANFKKQLEIAQKLNLTILNHKSNKYHTLDCKFGQIAHDTILIPQSHLPKEALPCKYCHVPKNDKRSQQHPTIISNEDIKIYLTDFTTKLKPDNNCTTPICKDIVNSINLANKSIDIALYGWSGNKEIYNALLNAKARGVNVRVVYETNNYYQKIKEIINIANISQTDNDKQLMHNKFIIIDNKKLFTGSMNFTNTGLSGFNSNCVFQINSDNLAKAYTNEFEQMLNGKFHQNKSEIISNTVWIKESKITPYFSPTDKTITTQIIPLINNAKNYVYIPTFVLTHDKLAKALINAKQRNVDIKIIIDATNTYASRSKVNLLRSSNIPIKVENYAGKLHSKSIIIDDKYIITGSMNFSNSGENKNDENCLIIESERFAKYYKSFFEYIWNKIPDNYLNEYIPAEGNASIGSCSDGIDNDFDGKIDLKDEGCF